MRAYSVTEFRENLATVLDKAEAEPIVINRNGKEYELRARPRTRRSPLDVPPVEPDSPISADDIVDTIKKSRAPHS
jgi:hypothetical protein